MARMTPEEKARRRDERDNAWKIGLEERIRAIVATWPPLTEEQQRVIAYNLYGVDRFGRKASDGPSAYEVAQRKKMNERAEALAAAKKAALSLTACDVCNLQPEVHHIRRGQGIDMHEWQPGRAEKLMAKATPDPAA